MRTIVHVPFGAPSTTPTTPRRATAASLCSLLSVCALAIASAACAHDEVVEACKNISCGEGDISSCISAREQSIGEAAGRCGDTGAETTLAIYVCQGTLTCDTKDTFATACADELAAYADVRENGAGGCPESPDAVEP